MLETYGSCFANFALRPCRQPTVAMNLTCVPQPTDRAPRRLRSDKGIEGDMVLLPILLNLGMTSKEKVRCPGRVSGISS
jgi:hypothetical protein